MSISLPPKLSAMTIGTPARWSDLSGMTVLVTGASSGIGRATAIALAAYGANLILLARNKRLLEEVRSEITRASPAQVRTIVADLNDTQAIRVVIKALPRLDALVNNAGHNIPQSFAEVDEGNFDAIFAL